MDQPCVPARVDDIITIELSYLQKAREPEMKFEVTAKSKPTISTYYLLIEAETEE